MFLMIQAKPISSSISRIALISMLLLGAIGMKAQSRKVMVQQKDTIPFYRGFGVSFDLVGAGAKILDSYGQYEGALRINLKDKYFPVIELGLGAANEEDVSTRLHYKTSAPYGRIGIDFNMMKNKHDDYRLYLGGRYAFTSFKYDISSPGLTDPVWGDHVDYNYPGNKATYQWLEFVGGIDAKIWKFFRLGWSVRYKRRLFHTEQEIGDPWYIPGFGKVSNSRLGATFNVTFEF